VVSDRTIAMASMAKTCQREASGLRRSESAGLEDEVTDMAV
jgi:hypothetical protein